MPLQSGIYRIVNCISGKCYVGSTKDFTKRKMRHLYALRHNEHHSSHMQKSFNLYGEDAFKWEIVEEVIPDRILLFERETYWVQHFQPEYNASQVSATLLGSKQSPEHIRKKAEALKGHDVSKENRQKLAERSREMWANRTPEEKRAITQKRSEEVQEKQRQRMRDLGKDPALIEHRRQANLGLKRSEETHQRLREAWVRRKQRELENPKPPVEDTRPPKEYKYSDERRRKMSEGKKASWDKKKAAQANNIEQPPLF